MGSGDSEGISGPEWGRSEARIHEFEQAWLRGDRPIIELYLDGEAGPRHELLIELVHTELECRLKASEPARVEEYLERYPELAQSDDLVLELIRAEWSFRRRLDPKLSRREYGERFPKLYDLLETLTDETPCSSSHSSIALSGLRMPSPTDFSLPRNLGKFELRQKVGEGAFAIVYKAWDTFLKREIAIKIPRPQAVEDRQDVRNFLREARNTIQLKHPNIVAIHDACPIDGIICVVRAYIEGITLAEQIQIAPLAPEEAAAIITLVAEALGYAHDQGVIHRDLKPSNILIDQQGQPYVSDFGLAKRSASDSTLLPGKSKGSLIGTPAYMSPEQARGDSQAVDPRSDIFSLGVILYELLTGALPFQGRGRLLSAQIENFDPPSPSTLNEEVTRELDRICLKALSKKLSDRYQTAKELANDLRNYLGGPRVEPMPDRSVARRGPGLRFRITPNAGSAILLTCLIISLVFWWRTEAQRQRDIILVETASRALLNLTDPGREAERETTGVKKSLVTDLWSDVAKISPLLEADPSLIELAEEAQLKLAERATAQGADHRAEGHWTKVIELAERLVQRNPPSFRHRRDLAYALKHQAAIRSRANDLAGSTQLRGLSLGVWQAAVATCRIKTDRDPQDLSAKLDLFEAMLGVAGGEHELGKPADLLDLESYRVAILASPYDARKDGLRVASLVGELAALRLKLSITLKSIETAKDSLGVLESLGDDPEVLYGLARTFMVLALANHERVQTAVASRFCRESISLYEILRRDRAESPDLRRRLGSAYLEMGQLLGLTDCGRDAITAYRKALELRTGLASEEPKGSTNWLDVAEVHSALAREPVVSRIERAWFGLLTIFDRLRVLALGPGIVENRRELARLIRAAISEMGKTRPRFELYGLVRAAIASRLRGR